MFCDTRLFAKIYRKQDANTWSFFVINLIPNSQDSVSYGYILIISDHLDAVFVFAEAIVPM